MIFRSGQLLLPERAQKPNNDINALGDHQNIFGIDNGKEEWNPTMFMQNIYGPKLIVSMPTPNLQVFSLWKTNEDDVYKAQEDVYCKEDKATVQQEKEGLQHAPEENSVMV